MKHLTIVLTITLSLANACAQDDSNQPTLLKIAPASAAASNDLRLLPAAPDLKDGNAAVVLLRMIWEQNMWLQKEWPKLGELAELPHTDPKIADFHFDSFQRQLYRAAMMKDADWNYPLDDEPWGMILLPDVQGLRQIAGRGLKAWIGQQIAKGDLNAAREGILTQLACARHIARTPILINHLVANAHGTMSLDRIELLISQPQSPNLYWALSGLPSTLGPVKEAMAVESRMLEKTLTSLNSGLPPIGDPAWKTVANEFSDYMNMMASEKLSEAAADDLKARLVSVGQKSLEIEFGTPRLQTEKMSEEEIVMRWVLLTTRKFNTQIENAYTLPAPQAIKKLVQLESQIAALDEHIQATASPFSKRPVDSYLAVYGFGRRVRFLQTVEAIRDHLHRTAWRNSGQLPKTLDDIKLPLPIDPFTNKPFDYSVEGNAAVLSMPTIDSIPEDRQQRMTYRLSL